VDAAGGWGGDGYDAERGAKTEEKKPPDEVGVWGGKGEKGGGKTGLKRNAFLAPIEVSVCWEENSAFKKSGGKGRHRKWGDKRPKYKGISFLG